MPLMGVFGRMWVLPESVRVRGSRELHAWLRTQGAAKLGAHLEAVMLADKKKGKKA